MSSQKEREYSVNYYWQHREHCLEMARARRQRAIADVIAAYGGKCQCCGETEINFLTVDHINGCTKDQRRQEAYHGDGMWGHLRRNNYPTGYQILCYNCNLGRALNGGICPHHDPIDI